jgi:hypothetical protein
VSTESLHTMTVQELKYERMLTKNNMNDIKLRMRGTATPQRMQLEREVETNRKRIDEIEARIARLERKTRTQP